MSEATPPRARWWRRHKALSGLAVLLVVLGVSVGGWAYYLNSQLAEIPRVDLGIKPRSDAGSGEGSGSRGPLNILIAGTDAPDGDTVTDLMRSGWEPGKVRSDTIMVLHVAKDRKSAGLVSVPRDTWTTIPGHGKSKINAAFSLGGPELYLDTLESFTGLRMDHVALIGWDGFKELSTAVGGVDVVVPEEVYDSNNDITWEAGPHHLEGQEALDYVRMRYGLGEGDFDRINRQQNFLRALLDKLVSRGTLANPLRLTESIQAIAGNLTLDSGFSDGEIRDLALSLRGLEQQDVTFATVPRERYDTIGGQSVVIVDRATTRRMFRALDQDRLAEFLEREGIASLPGDDAVS